jgi:two-component system OmpR family sensor kinase
VTWWIVALLVLAWLVGGVLLVTTVERRLVNDVDEDLVVSAQRDAVLLDTGSADDLARRASELRVDGSDTAVLVVSADGEVTAAPSGPLERPDPAPDLTGWSVDELRSRAADPFSVDAVEGEAEFRAVAVPLADGGAMVSAKSLASTDNAVHQLRRLVVVSLLVSLAGVVFLVWLISRQALRPLETVIGTAEQISAGSLHTRVEVHSSAPDVERLEHAMNTMLERLEAAFDATEQSEARMRQFVADASHELRTPLAAIIGYAELHQQRGTSTPDEAHVIERILAEGTRMQTLVEDLLRLARLDDETELARSPVDLTAVVDESVQAISVIDDQRSYTLSSPERVTVLADRDDLRRVFDNLLANVAAHTPPRSTCRVEVRILESDVIVEVADDGPGLTEEDAAHVFDRFWRAEPSRARPGGNGLGLSIVARRVRAHGGSISVTSKAGIGATFSVRLPALVDAGTS